MAKTYINKIYGASGLDPSSLDRLHFLQTQVSRREISKTVETLVGDRTSASHAKNSYCSAVVEIPF